MKPFSITFAVMLAATASAATNPPAAREDYIAHEWGTFTSVQGMDGVQFDWNPFVVEELPKFVYDANKPFPIDSKLVRPSGIFLLKSSAFARQRMETPVIYFYSDKARSVSVDVSFPGGRFTEWFPQLAPLALNQPAGNLLNKSVMRWSDVQILPGNGSNEARLFPKDNGGSHYYAARETDASGIKVKGPNGQEEHEKFLFYRGVASFEAPLRVTQLDDTANKVRLENRGEDAIGTFFVYSVRGNKASFQRVAALNPKSMSDEIDIAFDKSARPLSEVRADLAQQMRQALTSAGLYEREAAAMVKTWDDSWFAEQGTRVLYLLPQKWSDQVLPLTITPAPKELKRVFVGRAELITPAQEWAVLKEVTHFAEGGDLERTAAAAAVTKLGLGRFTEAVGSRLIHVGPRSTEYNRSIGALLDVVRKERSASTSSTEAKPIETARR